MEKEQIERLWNESKHHASALMYEDLTLESQSRIKTFVRLIELQMKDDFDKTQLALRASHPTASHALDIMMRTYGAAVSWRDKYKVAKGQEVHVWMLVELCQAAMDAVGWHATGVIVEEHGFVKLASSNKCVHRCESPAAEDNLCDHHREQLSRSQAVVKP